VAKLEDCIISSKDVLIEGNSGTSNATGQKVCFGLCGISTRATTFIHKLADIDDLKVMRLVQTTASAAPQVALVE
jgi:hypothetical protein